MKEKMKNILDTVDLAVSVANIIVFFIFFVLGVFTFMLLGVFNISPEITYRVISVVQILSVASLIFIFIALLLFGYKPTKEEKHDFKVSVFMNGFFSVLTLVFALVC